MNNDKLDLTPLNFENFNDNELVQILDEYEKTIIEYEKIFGENSLKNVILASPYDTTLRSYINITKKLKKAIEYNEKIEQIEDEIFKKIKF